MTICVPLILLLTLPLLHTCQPSRFTTFKTAKNRDVPIYFIYLFIYFFFFKGKNRHRPCLDLQYINFKYENCVSLAFKIAKIQGLQGGAAPWPPQGALTAGPRREPRRPPGPPAIGCPDFEYPNVGRYVIITCTIMIDTNNNLLIYQHSSPFR